MYLKPPWPPLLAACWGWRLRIINYETVCCEISVYKRFSHLKLPSDRSNMWLLLLFSVSLGVVGSHEMSSRGQTQQLQAVHCPPCERIHCSSRRTLKLQCKGGITTGICGCCPVCARAEGETCGGNWDYLGKCDEGLVCVYQDSAGGDRADAESRGICKAGESSFQPQGK